MNISELLHDRPEAVVVIVPLTDAGPERLPMEVLFKADFAFVNHGDYLTVLKSRDPLLNFDLNLETFDVDESQIDAAVSSVARVAFQTGT